MSGSTIVTYLGNAFDYKQPVEMKYDIRDIAHSLALTNRYRGHTRVPYSVAEHCVRVSRECHNDPLAGLLHDAAEAYIGDIASPQKKELGWLTGDVFHSFKTKERGIIQIIEKQLRIPELTSRMESAEVTEADKRMFLTEVRDLMPEHSVFQDEAGGMSPYIGTIDPWPWELAEHLFLGRFDELIAKEYGNANT